jgi:hypothetical protein
MLVSSDMPAIKSTLFALTISIVAAACMDSPMPQTGDKPELGGVGKVPTWHPIHEGVFVAKGEAIVNTYVSGDMVAEEIAGEPVRHYQAEPAKHFEVEQPKHFVAEQPKHFVVEPPKHFEIEGAGSIDVKLGEDVVGRYGNGVIATYLAQPGRGIVATYADSLRLATTASSPLSVCSLLPTEGVCAAACDAEAMAAFIPAGTCVTFRCEATDGRTVLTGGCH